MKVLQVTTDLGIDNIRQALVRFNLLQLLLSRFFGANHWARASRDSVLHMVSSVNPWDSRTITHACHLDLMQVLWMWLPRNAIARSQVPHYAFPHPDLRKAAFLQNKYNLELALP